MAFVIGAPTIAWSAIFIFLPFTALVVNTLTRPGSHASAAQVARHLEDFPYDIEPRPAPAPIGRMNLGKRTGTENTGN
jgi:hypothetical protein